MKNCLVSLSLVTLSLFAVGCKSNDVEPPKDYTGKYSVYTNAIASGYRFTTTITDEQSTIDVKKGDAANELNIIFHDAKIIATMDGSTFRILPQGNWYNNINGTQYTSSIIGDGAFADNKITFHFTGTSTDKSANFYQAVTVRGTKQ